MAKANFHRAPILAPGRTTFTNAQSIRFLLQTDSDLQQEDNMRRSGFLMALLGLFAFATAASADPQWLKLPPTPSLPRALHSGYAPVNGIKIWYAVFGHGKP